MERAGEEDVGVNFIVLPQFFDYALALIGTDNILGKFLLSSLRQSGWGKNHLHFLVSDVPPVQNLVENLVWSLVHPQPNTRRIDQTTMGLLLLQLLTTRRACRRPPATALCSPLCAKTRKITARPT